MGSGELEGTARGDVDLLATGDFDVLGSLLEWLFTGEAGKGGLTRAEPPTMTVSLPGGQEPPSWLTSGGQ